MTAPLALGVVRDFRAEGWPSMDLCADQLLAHLPAIPGIQVTDLETPFRRRFQRLPFVGRRNAAFNADRVINRHVVLPRFLRQARTFDYFHVADHTYAHVVLSLPPCRAGVFCHDLDAFRSLLEPEKERRPWWFRWLARRTLRGLQAAAVVFHSTEAVRELLLRHQAIGPDRLVHAPYGVSSEFTPAAPGLVELPPPGVPAGPFLLHVGNHIPRKRIDVLLDVIAAVRKHVPGLRLVQVGPPWSPQSIAQIQRLGIGADIVQFAGLSREQLAELYRRSAAVLVPSEAEGFGLPVIEALACGAAVFASDIPVLREVGGEAVIYRPAGDVTAWTETVSRSLAEPAAGPSRDTRLSLAARYSWANHARVIGESYLALAAGRRPHSNSGGPCESCS